MFCNNANDPKWQNKPDVPDFWLANKMFCKNLCVQAFRHYHISCLTSASFPIIHESLVYPPFVYILYDVCSEDVTGESSSAKYQWCN